MLAAISSAEGASHFDQAALEQLLDEGVSRVHAVAAINANSTEFTVLANQLEKEIACG